MVSAKAPVIIMNKGRMSNSADEVRSTVRLIGFPIGGTKQCNETPTGTSCLQLGVCGTSCFTVVVATYTGLFIINGGRNSYDPVEILAKKLRKLNETNILVITILESQKLS